jgi:hypothetical protein
MAHRSQTATLSWVWTHVLGKIGISVTSIPASMTDYVTDELSRTRGKPPLLEGCRARVRLDAWPDTETGLVNTSTGGTRTERRSDEGGGLPQRLAVRQDGPEHMRRASDGFDTSGLAVSHAAPISFVKNGALALCGEVSDSRRPPFEAEESVKEHELNTVRRSASYKQLGVILRFFCILFPVFSLSSRRILT